MFEKRTPAEEWKDFFTGLFKFAFWCIFLYHVGIFHLLASCLTTGAQTDDDQKAQMVIQTYVRSQYKNAQAQMDRTGTYAPKEYFSMLHRVDQLKDSLGYDQNQPEILWMMDLMQQSLRNGKSTYEELDVARTWIEKQPRAERKKRVYPHHCDKYIHHISWNMLPVWFWHVYRHMALYALILLLIWVYQKKDEQTLSIRSPLSFLFLVVLHPVYIPIVIGRAWRECYRELFASVELRRRKENIFEKFSREEREAIRAFARSAQSLRELKTWAAHFGERKHLAGLALVALIVCAISSKLEAKQTLPHQKAYITATISISSYALHTIDTDIGHIDVAAINHPYDDWELQPVFIPSVPSRKHFHFILSNGYTLTREPVPIGY